MRLFVANATKYNQEINYRLPEVRGVRTQRVPIGAQVCLGGPDLSSKDIESILEDKAKYGWTKADAVDRTKPFIGIVYSVDKPVKLNQIKSAMEHDEAILDARGKQNRDLASIATNNAVDEAMKASRTAQLQSTTVEMTEIEKPGVPLDHDPFGEGRVVRNVRQGEEKPRRTRKGRNK